MKTYFTEEESQKLKNLHIGHRDRQRNRLVNSNWQNCEDYEIMEYLLTLTNRRKDTNPLAHKLINEFGSVANVLDASVQDLQKVKGVGVVTATFLHSIPNLFKIYKNSKMQEKPMISNVQQVFEFFGKSFNHMPNEELHVLLVDANSKLISHKQVATGNQTEVGIATKTITEYAIRANAVGVILMHNHPGQNPLPSEEDIEITKQIYYNLVTCGILLIDHIIVCKNDEEFFSFKQNNIIDEYKKEYEKLMNIKINLKNIAPKYE